MAALRAPRPMFWWQRTCPGASTSTPAGAACRDRTALGRLHISILHHHWGDSKQGWVQDTAMSDKPPAQDTSSHICPYNTKTPP